MPHRRHHDETPNPTTQTGRGSALVHKRIGWGSAIAAIGILVAVAMPVGCSLVQHGQEISSLKTQAERRDREIDQLRQEFIKRLDRIEDKIDRLSYHERGDP